MQRREMALRGRGGGQLERRTQFHVQLAGGVDARRHGVEKHRQRHVFWNVWRAVAESCMALR
jgi:hypothetical protein